MPSLSHSNGYLQMVDGKLSCQCCAPQWCPDGVLQRVRYASAQVTGIGNTLGRIFGGGTNSYQRDVCEYCTFDRDDYRSEAGAEAANGTYAATLLDGAGVPVTPAALDEALAAPLNQATFNTYRFWFWHFYQVDVPITLTDQNKILYSACSASTPDSDPDADYTSTGSATLNIKLQSGTFSGGAAAMVTETAPDLSHDPAETTVTIHDDTPGESTHLEHSSGTWHAMVPFISCFMPPLGATREYAATTRTWSYQVSGKPLGCGINPIDFTLSASQTYRTGTLQQLFDVDQRNWA